MNFKWVPYQIIVPQKQYVESINYCNRLYYLQGYKELIDRNTFHMKYYVEYIQYFLLLQILFGWKNPKKSS